MRDGHSIIACWVWIAASACAPTRGLAGDGLARGCDEMPYVRHEAEAGTAGGGAVLRSAVDFDPANTAAEASNRQYIGLPVTGSFVQWPVNQAADGVTLRYTLPDNAAGTGVSGSLSIRVNGQLATTVSLGSYWAWTYFSTTDPSNTPGTKPSARFDEIHFRLPVKLQPGDVLQITKTTGDTYEYGIDFVELEEVPAALAKPAGYLSVADYGANGTDGLTDSAAFDAAWLAAKTAGTGLYIPGGKFILDRRWNLGTSSGISIQGAGIWFTELFFATKAVGAGGVLTGKGTTHLTLSNFFMNSALNERFIVAGQVSDYKAFNGSFGSGSGIHHVWLTHFEAGAWLADYTAPVVAATGFDFSYNRVRNNYADGINLCQGTSASVVRQCDFRSNGDDAMAVWPSSAASAPEGHDNVFHHNTVEFNYRAGGVGIFGGYGHQIHHCVIKDGMASAGMRFTEDFAGYHFQNNSSIRVEENTLTGCGTSQDLWNNARGAIEISGTGVQSLYFSNNDILNSPRHAVQLGGGHDLHFTDTTVTTTGMDNFNAPAGAAINEYGVAGSAVFANLKLAGIEHDPAIIQGNAAYILTVYDILATSPYEMEIRFAGYDRDEVLTNLPVLVKLSPGLTGFSYDQFASATGDDLRFRDANHHELNYEIESWNPGGTSYVWVQVPSFVRNGGIWAAWGASGLATQPAYTHNGAVWSEGYAAVYHANEGSGTRHDSTANARHGTPLGNTTGADGMVAGADRFDGAGDAVRLPKSFGLFGGTQALTVEFWFKANAVAPSSNYLTSPVLFQGRGENAWMVTFGDSMAGNALSPRLNQGGWITPASASGIQTGQWYFYSSTYTPSGTNNWKVYLDGALASQGTRTGSVTADTTLNNQYGGSDEAGTTRGFNGTMDEVRVSSATRTANWVWASWQNVLANETFATYGQVQEVGARYAFAAAAGSGGSVTGTAAGDYLPGTAVTVAAAAAPYYHWSHWTGDVPADQAAQNPLTLTLDQDRSVTAVFDANLTINGVPEWWLAQYGSTTDFAAAALADADGDGQCAWQEFLAGTDPTAAASVFRAGLEVLPSTGGVRITWSSVAGKSYRIERAADLTGLWAVVAAGLTATPPLNTHTEARPAFGRAFYRVAVE